MEGCPPALTCVRHHEQRAQCVDCAPEQFALDCPHLWDANLTAAAEETCGLTCLGERNSQCVSIGCNTDPSKNLTCVKASETWSQCVECSEDAFKEDCGHWAEDLLVAAEAACSTTCVVPRRPAPKPCDPATLTGCPAGLSCVKKDDHWAQCVDCAPERFALECPFLWDADFIAAAEETCGRKCLGERNNQCVSIDCNPDPSKNLTCVSSHGKWSQCVDCSPAAFLQDCGHWSKKLLVAAEAACSTRCSARLRLL